MTFAEYASHDAVALAALVANKAVSPAELVEAAIERIEAHNGTLNAVVYKAYDEARDEARRTAVGALPDGPFRGVPFLIKDLARPVAGWPSTWGSRFAETPPAARDGVLVERYRRTGLLLLGATNTPEFGIPGITNSVRLGPCRNPWNPDHISGGSSGGAAAAVASGMVPVAHASDGLGSIRIPAACCGLVGMKPTRDRNPIEAGALTQIGGLVVDHIVSRTVRDSAAMLDATGVPQAGSPWAAPPKTGPYLAEVSAPPGRLRIAWSSETPHGRPIDAEVQRALERTAETLAALGHDVRAEGLGVDYLTLYRAARDVNAAAFTAELRAIIARVGREPGDDDIEPLARRTYELGKTLAASDVFAAIGRMRAVCAAILERFQHFDVLVTPVLGAPPPRVDAMLPFSHDLKDFDRRTADTFPFTPPFNMTGQPAIALPLWQSSGGLPIGMMFAARYADEATLFRLAGQLERELPWRDRRPPVFG